MLPKKPFRYLLNGRNVGVESQDVRAIERTGITLPKVIDPDVIEFDLSSDSFIFDHFVGETEQPAKNRQSEMKPMVDKSVDGQTGNRLEAGISLFELTYYLGIRLSERRTAYITSDQLLSEARHMMKEPINDNEVPVNYVKVVSGNGSSF